MGSYTSKKTDPIQGPYSLRYVHLFVEARSAGAFILSRNGKSADFVGHSSEDLARTIAKVKHGTDYRYFWFSYAKSHKKASDLASYWHHRYRPSDNPASSGETSRSSWHCTIAGCTACALADRTG